MRILVVEDHADSADLLARVLRGTGHEVRIAGTVADTLRLCDESGFDLLIADIGLPDGDGRALLRDLRQRGRRVIRAIATSGFVTPDDEARSRAAGFEAHLTKPLDVAALTRAVAAITAGTAPAPRSPPAP
jgi:CheY-like chemotaxis protein